MKTTMPAALLCALLVGACGGGDGDALSKRELADKANAICAKYSKEGEKLGSPDLSDTAKAEDYFNRAKDLAQNQQDELEDLKPADDVKADYEKLTQATGEATKLLSDLAAAAAAEDRDKGVELVQKLTPISSAVDSAANTIGADDCAS